MPALVLARIVVDASVARAAGGEDAIYPVSKQCRDILSAILDICHHVVMTTEIYSEWKRHHSTFSRKWRVQMLGRKKVDIFGDVGNELLLSNIDELDIDDAIKNIMKKDVLLISAATATDRIILSLDDNARRHFAAAATDIPLLRDIVWMNPAGDFENLTNWLKRLDIAVEQQMLGYYL